MLNFKIEDPATEFLEQNDGKYNYKFKGKEYEITLDSLRSSSKELQQSFGHFCAKKCGGKGKKKGKSDFEKMLNPKSKQGSPVTGVPTYLPQRVFSTKVTKEEIVKAQLRRLALSTKLVEEKLDYPKVFRALLTEPHTALDQKKKTEEDTLNLTLFIDINVNYWRTDVGGIGAKVDRNLPNTIVEVAKKIKGVTVFASSALHNITYKDKVYDYYTDLLLALPKHMQQNVLVLTQGCGSMGTYNNIPQGKIRFLTPFKHGHNCGCGQIKKAADAKQKMYYEVIDVDSLKLIK